MAAAQSVIGITEEQIDAIMERARNNPHPPAPRATSAEYVQSLDLVIVKIDDGSRLTIPREQLEGLEDGTPEELSHIEIFGPGIDIAWVDLDVDHYLPHLLAGNYSSERWKQARKRQDVAA